MKMELEIVGFVPDKIKIKAEERLQKKLFWKRIRRYGNFHSYRITDCFRLLKQGNSGKVILLDHKHYDHYLKA